MLFCSGCTCGAVTRCCCVCAAPLAYPWWQGVMGADLSLRFEEGRKRGDKQTKAQIRYRLYRRTARKRNRLSSYLLSISFWNSSILVFRWNCDRSVGYSLAGGKRCSRINTKINRVAYILRSVPTDGAMLWCAESLDVHERSLPLTVAEAGNKYVGEGNPYVNTALPLQ